MEEQRFLNVPKIASQASGDVQDGVQEAFESSPGAFQGLWETIRASFGFPGALKNSKEASREGLGTLLGAQAASKAPRFFCGGLLGRFKMFQKSALANVALANLALAHDALEYVASAYVALTRIASAIVA